ncbi:hypothetical protein GX51_05755 [Blastomyces parvus]|uniref:Methyltransferase domain-containing protein n=1 Tax=Blastomyces parvus TaxID=2060905 RepID=A0A2B7WVD3_9EURO|nr:hypothetical protein GX51_05755 [Blastomyces parvus]
MHLLRPPKPSHLIIATATLEGVKAALQNHDSVDPDDAVLQAVTAIELSDNDEDETSDDGYASDNEPTISSSLVSSVCDYVFEHGRRFHKFHEGAYLFPNDELEQEREDMKHSMVVNMCGGKLHYAPLESPHRIIDIGTGTGVWAMDMGDQYPGASVLGIDLSPIQPVWVPPNVRFMVDDAECPWLQPDNHFDFIHIRHLAAAIKNFPKLIRTAYDKLRPGGWLEIQEFYYQAQCDDGTMPDDYAFAIWLGLMREGLAKFHVDLLSPRKHTNYIRDAGFTNVNEQTFKVPIGTWPRSKSLKRIGFYHRCLISDGLQGDSMKPFTKALGWSLEEVEVFNVQVRKSVEDSSVHSYLPFHVVFARKPPIVTDSSG